MTELDQALAKAYASQGEQSDVNQVYLCFLRTNFFVPVDKDHEPTEETPFQPLFGKVEERVFMLVFDSAERLDAWAGQDRQEIATVNLTGFELTKGIGDEIFLGVNIGTEFYKEFSPEEMQRLKMVAARIDELRSN